MAWKRAKNVGFTRSSLESFYFRHVALSVEWVVCNAGSRLNWLFVPCFKSGLLVFYLLFRVSFDRVGTAAASAASLKTGLITRRVV